MKQFFTSIYILLSVISTLPGQQPWMCDNVNVMTGDYIEEETDLFLGGPHPVAVTRTFNNQKLGWSFNHPNIFNTDPIKESERSKSDQKFLYKHNHCHHLTSIRSTNSREKVIFRRVDVTRTPQQKVTLTADNGKQVIYEFQTPYQSMRGMYYLLDRVIHTDGNEISYTYIPHKKQRQHLIHQIKDTNGIRKQIDYYDSGQVKTIYSSNGHDQSLIPIQYFYYEKDTTTVIDAYNCKRIYRFTENRLSSIETYDQEQLNRMERFFWNDDGLLTSQTVEDRNRKIFLCTTKTYDVDGMLIKQTLYGNLSGTCMSSIILNEQGFPIKNGIECYSVYRQYTKGLLTLETTKDGSSTRYLYDERNNNLKALFKCVGRDIVQRQFFFYDIEDLPIKTTIDDGSSENYEDISGVTERHITTYTHSNTGPMRGQPIIIENENFQKILKTYSDLGEVINEEFYDSQGQLEYTKTYHYDHLGRQQTVNDSRGDYLETAYDQNGHPSLFTHIDDKGNSTIQQKTFDFSHRVIFTKEQTHDGLETSKSYRYDAQNHPMSVTDQYDQTTTYEYDSLGRLMKITQPQLLDAYDRIISPTTTYEYDIFNNITKITDAMGYNTQFTYNAYGKPIRITYPDGTYEEYQYNLNGTLDRAKDKLGNHIIYHYDPLKRITSKEVIDPDGKPIQEYNLTYNGFRLTSKKEQSGITTNYHYDQFGSITNQQIVTGEDVIDFPKISNNKIQKSEYSDISYQFSESINAIGQRVLQASTDKETVTYDALGHITLRTHKDSFGNTLEQVEYRYDANGNITRAIYSGGTILAWEYGPGNRLEAVIENLGEPNQMITQYEYNEKGLRSATIKPDGISIHYRYNSMGLVKEVFSNDNTIHYSFEYDQTGNITSAIDHLKYTETSRKYNIYGQVLWEKLGNGLEIQNTYDTEGRRVTLELPDLSKILYQYDDEYLRCIIRINSKEEEQYTYHYTNYTELGMIQSSKMIFDLGNINYEYENNKLVNLSSPYYQQTEDPSIYTFNEKGELIADSHYTYKYDKKGHKLHHVPFNYDSNGNITSIIRDDGKINLVYDAFDRLIEVNTPSSTYQYTYDAFDRRIEKKVNGKIVHRYLYDGDNEIGSANDVRKLKELRILGLGNGAERSASIAIELDGKIYAPIHDLQNNIACLIDTDAKQCTEQYHYSAFGEELHEENKSPWRFSCKRSDPETGFVYFGRRYYHPTAGQWITKDPMGFIDGPNRYTFVKNDPINNFDLYGLHAQESALNGIFNHAMYRVERIIRELQAFREFFTTRYSYFETVRDNFEMIGHHIFGKVFFLLCGYYIDSPETGIYGKGELHDKIRVSLINGILNTHPHYIDSMDLVSKAHGNINIHYIFRPTDGWTWDMLKCGLIKLGYISPQARELANMWRRLIQQMGGIEGGGTIIHYAHSIGGADTYAAKSLLSPEELKMIRVITLGSAVLIPNEGFQDVTNYVSLRDGVPLFDPVRYVKGLIYKNNNIAYIGTILGYPFIDHTLEQDTYSELLEHLGQDFVDTYLLQR